jgi:sporulation protein YlmC with PRC-barrel domain
MNRKLQIIISASSASFVALSALAQDAITPKPDATDLIQTRPHHGRKAARLAGASKASDIIGKTVENNQDEKFATVEDIAVDLQSGRIVQVILSTGGVLGIDATLTAGPPGAFRCDATNKVLRLDTDKEKLKDAPKFEMSKWAEGSDTNHLAAVYRQYGEESAFCFIKTEDAVADDQSKVNAPPQNVSPRQADGTWEKNRAASDDRSLIPVSRLGQIQRTSQLIGKTVKNLQEEKLGKVENLLLDLSSGRVVAVVVSSGGFLGIGDDLSAVPPSALHFSTDQESLLLDMTKDSLTAAPHFKSNQWPDFAQPANAEGVYRAYQVEPYFAASTATGADNTATNARDRNGQTLTPLDQSNTQADLDTTAQIRKDIIAGKDMSVNAKNVKIITIGGHVTLRGPVNTAEEKRLVGDIAINIAKTENVDNQLEVR